MIWIWICVSEHPGCQLGKGDGGRLQEILNRVFQSTYKNHSTTEQYCECSRSMRGGLLRKRHATSYVTLVKAGCNTACGTYLPLPYLTSPTRQAVRFHVPLVNFTFQVFLGEKETQVQAQT